MLNTYSYQCVSFVFFFLLYNVFFPARTSTFTLSSNRIVVNSILPWSMPGWESSSNTTLRSSNISRWFTEAWLRRPCLRWWQCINWKESKLLSIGEYRTWLFVYVFFFGGGGGGNTFCFCPNHESMSESPPALKNLAQWGAGGGGGARAPEFIYSSSG